MKRNRSLIYFGIVFVITILIGIPLFNPKFNIYIDEGIQYISRAYETTQNGIFENVIPNFANGYGYSCNLFEPSLANLGLTILNFYIQNINLVYKIFVLIIFALSGLSMYKFVEKISENKNIAILAAALYMIIPYHLTSIFVRNALNEQIAITLIPFVFLGIYYILNNEKKHLYFALALSLLFFADLSIAWCMVIISLIYFMLNIKCFKEKSIRNKIILNFSFILVLTAVFWLPNLETKFYSDYKANSITEYDKEEFVKKAISIRKLFVTAKQEKYVFEVGPLFLALFALTPMALISIKKDFIKDYIIYIILCLICFFAATNYFPWSFMPKIVIKLGEPWRILVFANFFLAVVGALNIGAIINNLKLKDAMLLILFSAIYICFLTGYIQKADYIENIENISLGTISGKVDEISAGINNAEFLPVTAYYNKFYLATREHNIYVLKGKSVIENESQEGLNYTAKIKTYDEAETQFELPLIYYPGYSVKVDGVEQLKYETPNGLLGFSLGKNENVVLEVTYPGTKIHHWSIFISSFSALIFAVMFIKNLFKEDKKLC